jgi:hypothetical protein
MDYSQTTKNKTVRALTSSGSSGATSISLSSGVALATAAVSSITYTVSGSPGFAVGSRFSLYGWN